VERRRADKKSYGDFLNWERGDKRVLATTSSPLFKNHMLTIDWTAAHSSVPSIWSFTPHSPPTDGSL
jgi:hypothetical protein